MEDDSLVEEDTEPPGGRIYRNQQEPNRDNAAKQARVPVFSQTSHARCLVENSSTERAFRRHFFPQITQKEWKDWRWQMHHRVRDLRSLEQVIVLSDKERNAFQNPNGFLPLAITPYYLSLIDPTNPLQPLRRTVVPTAWEQMRGWGEEDDPLHEDANSPVPAIVHRYPDRVLFLVSESCASYCRYCTRSRMVGRIEKRDGALDRWKEGVAYIAAHPEVRDVLLSGGDPLTLPDEKLEWLLGSLRRIPHVEIIRLGTKVPATLPMRITSDLVKILRRFHPLWMSIHMTHPDELTESVAKACERLADAGIPLGSQTVLLAGVNDDVATMKRLFQGLLMMRVKPYYLYQCDPIPGSSHFRTPVARGLEIIKGLRGFTSGYAVPSYVIDAPGGGGKIPLLPEYVMGREDGYLLLRNYEGRLFRYPDSEGESPETGGGAR